MDGNEDALIVLGIVFAGIIVGLVWEAIAHESRNGDDDEGDEQ